MDLSNGPKGPEALSGANETFGSQLARLPELVVEILRFARAEDLMLRRVGGSALCAGGGGIWDESPLKAALRVNRVWAVCTMEVLHEHLMIDSPDQLNRLLAGVELRRLRVCGLQPSFPAMDWASAPPVVRVLDFSKWSFQTVLRNHLLEGAESLPAIWERMKTDARKLNESFQMLAADLATGAFLKSCVNSIVFPDIGHTARDFDETVACDVPPTEDEAALLKMARYELSRFFFLSPGAFSLLVLSATNEPFLTEIVGCTDLGIVHLLGAAQLGRLENLTSLTLENNLSTFRALRSGANEMEILESATCADDPPVFYREDDDGFDEMTCNTPIGALEEFWSAVPKLTTLDMGFHGSPLALLTAALCCPLLKTIRCRPNYAVFPGPTEFDPRQPHINEQTVSQLVDICESLEELDLEIGLGNLPVPAHHLELYARLPEPLAPSRLRKLKLSYDPLWAEQMDFIGLEMDEEMYDPSRTPSFLSHLALRSAHTLTILNLELQQLGISLEDVDFGCCTALEEVRIGLSLRSYDVRTTTQKYPGGPAMLGLCPGDQFSGSRKTLRKLDLLHLVTRRTAPFRYGTLFQGERRVPWEYFDDGTRVTVYAEYALEFPKLEKLSLSFADLARDPVLLWLGRCPALREVDVLKLFRVPDRSSFLGEDRMQLVDADPERPAAPDPRFAGTALRLAARATLRLADLNREACNAFEPLLSDVRFLQLGCSAFERRSMPNRMLRRWLSAASQLDSLRIGYREIDNGTLKAIAELGAPGLRTVIIHGQGHSGSPRKLRMEAVAGFARKMVGKALPGDDTDDVGDSREMYIRFTAFSEVIDFPSKSWIERFTKCGRRGDRESSTTRHIESFIRRNQDFVRAIDELGIGWIGPFSGEMRRSIEQEMANTAQ